MPVLPPIAASTWARSVVGTCTSGRPRSSPAPISTGYERAPRSTRTSSACSIVMDAPAATRASPSRHERLHPLGHLLDAETGGVDGVGGERVDRGALVEQRPDAGQAIAVVAGEQRTARDVPHPAGDLLGRRGEADDRTRTDQPAAVVRIEQRPASRGDDRVGNGARFLDRVALEPPEVRLPVAREDLRDGAARGGLDEAVGVDERTA